MIRMLTAVAAAALLATPALAQDVSAGGKASGDQERVTPLSEPMNRQSQGEPSQQGGGQDQTAEAPAADDEPVTGRDLGQTDQLDQDQADEQAQQALPPIEDDQTAQMPEEEGSITGEQEGRRSDQLGTTGEDGAVERQGVGPDAPLQPGAEREEDIRR